MHNVLIIDDDRELCLLIKRSVLLEDTKRNIRLDQKNICLKAKKVEHSSMLHYGIKC